MKQAFITTALAFLTMVSTFGRQGNPFIGTWKSSNPDAAVGNIVITQGDHGNLTLHTTFLSHAVASGSSMVISKNQIRFDCLLSVDKDIKSTHIMHLIVICSFDLDAETLHLNYMVMEETVSSECVTYELLDKISLLNYNKLN